MLLFVDQNSGVLFLSSDAGAVNDLVAADILSGAPTVGEPTIDTSAIAQVHALTGADLSSTPVIDAAVIGQIQALSVATTRITWGVTRDLKDAVNGSTQHGDVGIGGIVQASNYVMVPPGDTMYVALRLPTWDRAYELVVTHVGMVLVGAFVGGAQVELPAMVVKGVVPVLVFSVTRADELVGSYTVSVALGSEVFDMVVSVDWNGPFLTEGTVYHTHAPTTTCAKCDHHFIEGEGGLISGIPYCRMYGCYVEELSNRRERRY